MADINKNNSLSIQDNNNTGNNHDNIEILRSRELTWLLDKAWKLRTSKFPDHLTASAPGAKTYITDHHRNKKNTFVNISVTGTSCALHCDHCQAGLLESMEAVSGPEELAGLGQRLVEKGCEGVLLSGGANEEGEVPISGFLSAIPELKKMGLKVLVHSGLASEKTAGKLKESGADQVLLDIIGDEGTIRDVYHLDKTPDDIFDCLSGLVESGLDVVPHILIGLHYGKIVGEYKALDMIMRSGAGHIVFIVLMPKPGTPMEDVTTPSAVEIARIVAIARILNPEARITLGCARPAGDEKVATERYAVMAGINGIAYPLDETINFAKEKGLAVEFKDTCCSLL
ncbi:MAG: radical SAM protein [Thermoplasmata archaeon]|nr:radical SAM protein [Thermoplasmata archaeon]